MSVLALPTKRLMAPATLLALLAILLMWSPQAAVNGRRTLSEKIRGVSPVLGSRWSPWYYKPRGGGYYGVNGGRTLRENAPWVSAVAGSRWSPWHTALVPRAPRNSKYYEPRARGHYGFIDSDIRKTFRRGYDNGIYELRVSKGMRHLVVYVGSAYRKGPGSLRQRILEYCRGGSHKEALINRALRLGYTLSVRAQNIRGSRKHVQKSENKYLAKYDYAWNQRNNGRIRANVPSI